MQKMANVYFDGKHYVVPDDLTIMTAMEYAGIKLVKGVGCRHGFCGACATIYRIKGENKPHFVLSCQTKVEDEMHVASLPFFPLNRRDYDINDFEQNTDAMMKIFPEIFACIGCGACSKSCTRGLNVMQYIAYAKRGDFEKCAQESFDCTACGICSVRCPANISHNLVGLLARRITGKFIQPEAKHNTECACAIEKGEFDAPMAEIMGKSMDELKEMYDNRDFEK